MSEHAADELSTYLRADHFLDHDHPAVQAYARKHGGSDEDGPTAVAVRLYYAVRDGFRYTPWAVNLDSGAFRASRFLSRGARTGGHCIDKATLLASCARARGIPTRLHYADVRNHVSTQELERQLGTSLLVFHGYVELHLEGRWVAATPAFNRSLCEHLGVDPLEFDGHHDSVFQAYDREGGQFMEYVTDHGHFATIPYDQMIAAWKHHYPILADTGIWPRRQG